MHVETVHLMWPLLDAPDMQVWVVHGRIASTLFAKPQPPIPPSRLQSIPLPTDNKALVKVIQLRSQATMQCH